MVGNRKAPRKEHQSKRAETLDHELSWPGDFLDALADCSNVSKAAREANISASRAYKLRREDPEFARQWLAALYEGYIHLEMEVLGRLREGKMKTDDSDKFDFASAIRLLSAHRDNAAKAVADQRNVSAEEVRASIDRKVEAIRVQLKRGKEPSRTLQ